MSVCARERVCVCEGERECVCESVCAREMEEGSWNDLFCLPRSAAAWEGERDRDRVRVRGKERH